MTRSCQFHSEKVGQNKTLVSNHLCYQAQLRRAPKSSKTCSSVGNRTGDLPRSRRLRCLRNCSNRFPPPTWTLRLYLESCAADLHRSTKAVSRQTSILATDLFLPLVHLQIFGNNPPSTGRTEGSRHRGSRRRDNP